MTFSALPAEIHISIANYCENNDLINLCITSKRMSERCLHILYRHVDLPFDEDGLITDRLHHSDKTAAELRRSQQFVHTLLSHPEYGKYVRSWTGRLYIPKDMVEQQGLWRAMQSLTHVQSVDVSSLNLLVNHQQRTPIEQVPDDLFQSATSVKLVGYMSYRLAKSILNAINPATLNYLCLDMVQDLKIGRFEGGFLPGERGEDGRIIAHGATSGLLTTLTGRCTALRTLILRRLAQGPYDRDWLASAQDTSYIEWASFIRSIQGTVENFTFEHFGNWLNISKTIDVDERFRRFIFPAIASGSWPCLTAIELRGVRDSNDQDEKATLTMELRASLGESVNIVVEEEFHYLHYFRRLAKASTHDLFI